MQMDSRSDRWIQDIQVFERKIRRPPHQNQAKTIEPASIPFFLSLPEKIEDRLLRDVSD